MKVLITGTHFTPALAVIEELKNISGTEIIYIGRLSTMEGDKTKSMESQILNALSIKFIPIISGRLQRSFSLQMFLSLLKIPIGFIQSIYYLLIEKPDVVLSMGGYISVPVIISSWLLSKPIIIHEQTLIPGLANKINSFFADKIALSFPQSTPNKKNTILTGNPLRKEILDPGKIEDEELKEFVSDAVKNKEPLILVTGGNQGSHIINQTVSKSLENIIDKAYVVHQTGDSKYADFDKLTEQKKLLKNGRKYLVRKWISGDDWGFLLKKADLAVSRAGINTLLELAFYSVPTIAIPLPPNFNKEQSFNADFFEDKGLVKSMSQNKLNEESLVKIISEVLSDLANNKKSAKQASTLIIPDAAKRLALEVIILAKKH